MYTSYVWFETVEDAKKFVNICNSVDFSVKLVSGEYAVDAKSILGLFSLDLSKKTKLQADCDPDHPFVQQIKEFER